MPEPHRMGMPEILLGMTMLQYGGAQGWDKSGSAAVPCSREPTGVASHEGAEYWLGRWLAAYDKETVRVAAQAELEAWRCRPPEADKGSGETRAELENRVVVEGGDWPVKDVARHFNCSARFVTQARANAAKAAAEHMASNVDDLARYRELRERGLTGRQIRLLMRIGGSKLDSLAASCS